MNPLHTIMNPRSIVVAGVSNNFMKMGSIQALTLLNSGFEGEILFLHPSEETILGRRTYKDPAHLPYAPDLALLVTPTKITPALLDALGAKGVRHAIVITAGFREVGEDGAALEKELIEAANRYGIRFVGPNCIGVLNAYNKLNVTVLPYKDRPGHLGLISQSGTYVTQTLPYLRERGIRYSQAISVGNSTNIDLVDGLEYLGDDPNTRAVALYIEGIRRGREFLDVARSVTRKKPVVALYVGGTEIGSRSCMSHTGSMGGPDTLYDGLFEQAGIIRASTVLEMFEWTQALANMPTPAGNRVAILTHSGGPATSMADACEKSGLSVPVLSESLQKTIRPFVEATGSTKNPIDLTFSLAYDSFSEQIPEILFNCDEIDGVLIHGLMDTGFASEFYETIAGMLAITKEDFVKGSAGNIAPMTKLPREKGKPLVASSFIHHDHASEELRNADVPLLLSPERAVHTMAALVRYGKIKRRWAESPEQEEIELKPSATTIASLNGTPVMNEYEAKALLARYGVLVPEEQRAGTLREALIAASDIGYPVVMKGLAAGVAHKTEAGLVHLNLRSAEEVKEAWIAVEKAAPGCMRLVAKMLKGERELVVGMTRFPAFGPCVMLGIGGIFTEAVKDVTFRVAPVTYEDALLMPESLRLSKLFAAQRGLPEIDRAALAKTVMGVGRLAIEHPEIAEIDINPLIVVGAKPIAADALIVLRAGSIREKNS